MAGVALCGGSHSRPTADLSRSFSQIGQFTLHKEVVSAKVGGETALLQNPALDRIIGLLPRKRAWSC